MHLCKTSILPITIPKKEQLIRGRLNLVLSSVLALVKSQRLAEASETSFQAETTVKIHKRFGWKDGPLINQPITGRIDYGIWHPQPATLENNVLVIEAKTRDKVGTAEAQLLAYLGK